LLYIIAYTEKNDFAERYKILLDTVLNIILLDHQNNFDGILKIMQCRKKFWCSSNQLSVLYNYFDSSIKLFFRSVSSQNFKSLSKTVFSVYIRRIFNIINFWKYTVTHETEQIVLLRISFENLNKDIYNKIIDIYLFIFILYWYWKIVLFDKVGLFQINQS